MSTFYDIWILLQLIPFCRTSCSTDATCFDKVCLDPDYCHDIRPNRNLGKPIIVDMKYEIDSIISVDEDQNVVGIQLSLTQTWMDDRISLANETFLDENNWTSVPRRLYKEPDTLPAIWIPNLWTYSMTDFSLKGMHEDQSLLWIQKAQLTWNKTTERLKRHDQSKKVGYFLHYYTQFDIYVKCDMDFRPFPFDHHICTIEMTSVDLNANVLKFVSEPRPDWHYKKKMNKIRYFRAELLPLYEHERTYEGIPWSVTGFKLELTRRRSEYVYSYMFPAALCVIISWVCFVMPPEEVEGRVAILITMILVLVTIFNGVLEKSPRASDGTTAMIIWMLSMFMFVFAAFVGYSISLVVKKKRDIEKALQIEQQKLEQIDQETKLANGSKMNIIDPIVSAKESYFRKQTSDVVLLLILSTSFMLFCVFYILIYVF